MAILGSGKMNQCMLKLLGRKIFTNDKGKMLTLQL